MQKLCLLINTKGVKIVHKRAYTVVTLSGPK